MTNRLGAERSPYLRQHADNPVDWYPWGEAAFARARDEQKPIFLSIGYSTCHWCHVMAHESFEDASIAAALNRDFVSIKLDREERPDLDRVYMTFVQATTGAGGWPMTVFLTPDLAPFFGGTYFPPTSKWGRPGLLEMLQQIAEAWRKDPAAIAASAGDMLARLRQATSGDARAGDALGMARAPVGGRTALAEGVTAFLRTFDRVHGGFGGAPKFPRPSELLFLFDAYASGGDIQARYAAEETLRKMAAGGLRDHVGGGFHRYSVDAQWRVPHFEKMLYDQAQLALAYLTAWQTSGDVTFSVIAEDTLDYVQAELTDASGAFYSAEDADSRPHADSADAREGAAYVWSAAEIDRLFGDDAPVVRRRFGIEDQGNAVMDPHGEFRDLNVLHVAEDIEAIAARTGRAVEDVMRVLATARQRLYDARASRPRPHRDDKVLTSWNGLMIAAYARAARVLVDSPNRARWRDAAVAAASAIDARLWRAESAMLLRRYRDGEAAIPAFCEDYACLIWGLLELVETTGDARWLTWARTLMARQQDLFFDAADGGWFATAGDDPSVLLRLKEDYDGAEPSAASVTVRNLLALAHLTGDESYRALAGRALGRYGAGIGQVARVMPLMLSALARWHGTPVEIAIAGPRDDARTVALERAAARTYQPCAIQLPVDPAADRPLADVLPWLKAMAYDPARGPVAYVCANFACHTPTGDPDALGEQLMLAASPPRIILS